MLKEGTGVKRVIIRAGRTDLRRGIDGLKSIIQLAYGMNPMEEGTLFLFCGSRRDRIKGLLYEGDGFLLLTKRITDGAYQWPRKSTDARELSKEEFSRLMHGFTVTSSIRSYQDIGCRQPSKQASIDRIPGHVKT